VERILVIGKTQPDWDKREGDIVSCTVGITPECHWRRIRHAPLSSVKELRTFTWADIDMVSPKGPKRDPRPESRELNPTVKDPIRVDRRILDRGIRRGYVEACIQTSIAKMRAGKKTLGIIRPLDLDFKITKSPEKKDYETQMSLLDWMASDDPYAAKLARDIAWKKEYAKKPIEVRFQFYCGDECELENGHDMKVLDIELFMLYRHSATKGRSMDEAIEVMARKIESDNKKLDIFLGLGTHRYYPFKSYMVGSSMRFQKDVKPLPIE
jgi:hypothetical protein